MYAPLTKPESSRHKSSPVRQRTTTHYAGGLQRLPDWAGVSHKPAQPGDRFEREANHTADQVMNIASAPAQVQRDSAQSGGSVEAPASVHQTIGRAGQTMDASTRAFMESRFGQPFGDVRIHTDSGAAESAMHVNAAAYTVGNHIVFGAGQYNPHSQPGRQLIAHELTHTIQQGGKPGALQRAAPAAAAGAGGMALAMKCAVGAAISAVLDLGIQGIMHMWREWTWRFWEMTVDYCSIILSAVLGCFGGIVAAKWLEPWLNARLGARLGGAAGTLLGKILIWAANKAAVGVPKGLIGALLKLGCISDEQADEIHPGISEE